MRSMSPHKAIFAITVRSNIIFRFTTNGIHLWILDQKSCDFLVHTVLISCNIIYIIYQSGETVYIKDVGEKDGLDGVLVLVLISTWIEVGYFCRFR